MKNLTDITVLLDRTGSMAHIAEKTVTGLNEFIKTQKMGEGDAVMTLVQFDSQDPYEIKYVAMPIKEVKEMQFKEFEPRAMTPLHDALGRMITSLGARLGAMDEANRPDKVVMVVLTDGYENASKEYTGEKIKEMITHQREKYNWEFVFIGAGVDAVTMGTNLGIDPNLAINAASVNVAEVYAMTSSKLNQYRSKYGTAASLSYSDEERSAVA
jgi:uncharacterized protein YegL